MAVLSGLLFFVGLFFGSFFLVVVDRIPRKKSFLTGRSVCDSCGHVLAWYDLIPLVSFLGTRGRCRYCRKRLSKYYPFVELVTGILFASVPWFIPATLHYRQADIDFWVLVLFFLFTMATFIMLFFADLRYGIIPFIVILPAILVTAVFLVVVTPEEFVNHLLSALGAGFLFLVLFGVTKGKGMGFGDVVLVVYLGLLLGFPAIGISLYLAFLTGAVVSLILVLSGQKKLRGGTVPFGPFLIFSAFVSLFWGAQMQELFAAYFLR